MSTKMSRRSRQADLRRRMAEARAQLANQRDGSSSLSSWEFRKQADLNPSNGGNGEAPSDKKRSLPSKGGILRESKYSSVPNKADQETASPGEANNADSLRSLMGGYDDSSSEDENDPKESKSDLKDTAAGPKVSFVENEVKQTILIPQSESLRPLPNDVDLKKRKSLSFEDSEVPKAAKRAKENDVSSISDEVWKEFNDLIDSDPGESTVPDETKPEPSTDAKPDATTNGSGRETEKISHEKKTKKKKKKTSNDIYDNKVNTEAEQASYEARLARLIMMSSRKKSKSKGDSGEMPTFALPQSEGIFYHPALAFQEDETLEDDVDDNDNTMTDNLHVESHGIQNKDLIQPSNVASKSVNLTSNLAKILRKRRNEARLRSLGAFKESNVSELESSPKSDSKQNLDDNNISDGRWF